MAVDVSTFIKEHKHINYCEVIIFPDGNIEYANPSHLYHLIKVAFGVNIQTVNDEVRDYIWGVIPQTCSPLHWLINKTGCCSVWYNIIITPTKPTNKQINAIDMLKKSGVVCIDADCGPIRPEDCE